MNLQDLRILFATESKKATAAYFQQRNAPEIVISEKAKAAAKIIREGKFGCNTAAVTALVSTIIGENLEPLMYAVRVALEPGVIIVFQSTRVAPGQWIPELVINREGGDLNNLEAGPSGRAGTDQIKNAKQPSDQEIDAFFEKMSVHNLRLVLGSEFGARVLLK